MQILVLTGADPEEVDTRLVSDDIHFGPWSVFKDWYYYLLEHECFWEAQRILHSLFHKVPLPQCKDMVNDFIKKALSTNIGQESVQIAVSSLIQRFVYVDEIKHSSLLAVVQWNDAIAWSLFGATFAKAGEECISLFSRICLRRSIEHYLEPSITLPLNGVHGNDDLNNSLSEAVGRGGLSVLRQAVVAEPIRCTLDELNGAALLKAAQLKREGKMKPFLKPRTVKAQDGYQRASLHWACLSGHLKDVKLLLDTGEADAGLPDWFGCTPVHYAVRSKDRILELLLESNSAKVNMKDPNGLTPLRMAILNRSPRKAKILIQHGATLKDHDREEIALQLKATKTNTKASSQRLSGMSEWEQLLSMYADPLEGPPKVAIGGGHNRKMMRGHVFDENTKMRIPPFSVDARPGRNSGRLGSDDPNPADPYWRIHESRSPSPKKKKKKKIKNKKGGAENLIHQLFQTRRCHQCFPWSRDRERIPRAMTALCCRRHHGTPTNTRSRRSLTPSPVFPIGRVRILNHQSCDGQLSHRPSSL